MSYDVVNYSGVIPSTLILENYEDKPDVDDKALDATTDQTAANLGVPSWLFSASAAFPTPPTSLTAVGRTTAKTAAVVATTPPSSYPNPVDPEFTSPLRGRCARRDEKVLWPTRPQTGRSRFSGV